MLIKGHGDGEIANPAESRRTAAGNHPPVPQDAVCGNNKVRYLTDLSNKGHRSRTTAEQSACNGLTTLEQGPPCSRPREYPIDPSRFACFYDLSTNSRKIRENTLS
jgi:hypothetical protein